jgi:hypothetical protein
MAYDQEQTIDATLKAASDMKINENQQQATQRMRTDAQSAQTMSTVFQSCPFSDTKRIENLASLAGLMIIEMSTRIVEASNEIESLIVNEDEWREINIHKTKKGKNGDGK